MHRNNLTDYDKKPEAMINYLRYYGPHFSKKLCEFAVSMMTKENDEPIKPFSKEEFKKMLDMAGVVLKHDQMYDGVYVLNMGVADYLGSSIVDDMHLAKYVKDVIDDPDGCDGLTFNRFYSDCCYKGIAIDWEDML